MLTNLKGHVNFIKSYKNQVKNILEILTAPKGNTKEVKQKLQNDPNLLVDFLLTLKSSKTI